MTTKNPDVAGNVADTQCEAAMDVKHTPERPDPEYVDKLLLKIYGDCDVVIAADLENEQTAEMHQLQYGDPVIKEVTLPKAVDKHDQMHMSIMQSRMAIAIRKQNVLQKFQAFQQQCASNEHGARVAEHAAKAMAFAEVFISSNNFDPQAYLMYMNQYTELAKATK